MALGEQEKRVLIRVLSGDLPPSISHKVSAGFGNGAQCIGCGARIKPTQIEYEVESIDGDAATARPLSLHLDCYATWANAAGWMTWARRHVNGRVGSGQQVFLIAYTRERLVKRASLLVLAGFKVDWALGNAAAQEALQSAERAYDLFVIGNAAPQEIRTGMMRCLRSRYPRTRILALGTSEETNLDDLKYNADDALPELWLPMAALAAGDAISL